MIYHDSWSRGVDDVVRMVRLPQQQTKGVSLLFSHRPCHLFRLVESFSINTLKRKSPLTRPSISFVSNNIVVYQPPIEQQNIRMIMIGSNRRMKNDYSDFSSLSAGCKQKKSIYQSNTLFYGHRVVPTTAHLAMSTSSLRSTIGSKEEDDDTNESLTMTNRNTMKTNTTTATTTKLKVVVIGGGWAGFSVTDALASSRSWLKTSSSTSFDITVVDASNVVGGLASGWNKTTTTTPMSSSSSSTKEVTTMATSKNLSLQNGENDNRSMIQQSPK
jgi:hypothetical protein